LTRKKLYIILSLALVAGYALLFFEFLAAGKSSIPDLCIFRQVTGMPCPSCGSTRSVFALLHGNITAALLLNPFGLIITAIMFLAPLWITFDLVTGKKSLLDSYFRTEVFVRKPVVASVMICLVLSNWVWNIMKGI
jgi:hypothetical protein